MPQISLLLADIDGTLVTELQDLTEWAKRATGTLREVAIRAIVGGPGSRASAGNRSAGIRHHMSDHAAE